MLRLAGCLTLCLSGCTVGGGEVAPVPTLSPSMPYPVGVLTPTVGTPPPDDCNPLASLRPAGALPSPGAMPPHSTMERIAQRGRLIVGTDQITSRLGDIDPSAGRIVGFELDIARQITRAVFGEAGASRIHIVPLASSERIAAITEGTVDMVVQTMTITCDRLRSVSFSTVYYQAAQRILVPLDSPVTGPDDLAGRRVCTAKGSTSLDNVAVRAPAARLVSVTYWTDCLVLLQQGQADAITTDDTILAALAAQDPNVHIVGAGFHEEPYGVAVRRSDEDFLRFVNGVLERFRNDGGWRRSYQTWLGTPAPKPPEPRYRD